MRLKPISFFAAVFLTAQSVFPLPVFAGPSIPVTAASVVLMDSATRQIIYSKTPNLRRAPASTTKLLTALVAVERMDLNAVVTIPAYIEKIPPSKIHLRRGERFRVRELIRAVLISSANDAAEALAYAGGGGSRYKFMEWMNQKARSLGCKQSHWINPSGLPGQGQYSTAADMALIMNEVRRSPFLVQTLQTKNLLIKSASGRKVFLRNHNRMLGEQVIGKTGWTRLARHCFVGEFTVGSRKVMVSMLGSRGLWRDLRTLVNSQRGPSWINRKKNLRKAAAPVKTNAVIQRALRKAGYYNGPINGKIGPLTTKSIKRFQKAKGIQQTGSVGPQTWNALRVFA